MNLFAICKLHLETEVQTGARNRADTRASGVWLLVWIPGTPDSFPSCLAPDLGTRGRWLLLLGTNFWGHWALFWAGHWVSEVPCPSCKGHHPVRLHWPNSQEASPASCPLGARINCSSMWSRSHFYSESTRLTSHTLLLLGLWRPPSTFFFLLPLLLRVPSPRCEHLGWDPDVFCGQFCPCLCHSESTVSYRYHTEQCQILWGCPMLRARGTIDRCPALGDLRNTHLWTREHFVTVH